jgi:hypothetical protein
MNGPVRLLVQENVQVAMGQLELISSNVFASKADASISIWHPSLFDKCEPIILTYY